MDGRKRRVRPLVQRSPRMHTLRLGFHNALKRGLYGIRILCGVGALSLGVVGAGLVFWGPSLPLWARPLVQSFHALWAQSTASLGLTVREIVVHGHEKTSRAEILKTCPFQEGSSLLGISPEDARRALSTLPWVASVSVKRHLPHTLVINIVERRPLGVWTNTTTKSLVDQNGHVFSPSSWASFKNLPVLMGPEAPRQVPALFRELERYPDLKKQLKMAVYLPSHRWYVVLSPSIYVYLPYQVSKGLERLDHLMRVYQLLKRDIQGVDLRVEDKLFFHLTPSAQAQLEPKGPLI